MNSHSIHIICNELKKEELSYGRERKYLMKQKVSDIFQEEDVLNKCLVMKTAYV